METRHAIGVVDWIRNAEFGVLLDCVTGVQCFFHCRQNPNIYKISENDLCVFQLMPDSKKEV